ncbi:MAG: HEPN domain-containing protein [Candidatus Methanocomedens sp.]|nr:MAG: HEPN domain-containing protein [ANME-2 cluster archaeon]
MAIKPDEWLRQAQYDMETADYLFEGERYFYAVFMCHLSIEKALKGLYVKRFNKTPPKTHNLIYLIEFINIDIPENHYDVIFTLNRISVPARYPDNLQTILKEFNKSKTIEVIEQSKEVLKWLKTK